MPRTPPNKPEIPKNLVDQDREPTMTDVAGVVGATPTTEGIRFDPSKNDLPPLVPGMRNDDELDRPPLESRALEMAPVLPATDMERLTRAMESIAARNEQSPNSELASAIALLAASLTGLQQSQLQGAQIIAAEQRRNTRPENQFPPSISVFNPRGDKDFPRPPLKCEMFLPWPVWTDQESLTREELELLNLISHSFEVSIMRNDRTKIKMTVKVTTKMDSDEPSKILITHETAFNNDYHRQMPFDWIRQLVTNYAPTKAAAQAVLTMDEELALILAGKLNDGSMPPPLENGLPGRVVSVGA